MTQGGGLSVVTVRIGAQEFAVDIRSVRELRGWTPPTPLAHAPAYVQGMVDLRGVVIPIIDLGARLGLAPIAATATSVIVVAQIKGRLAGLLVDGVNDLIELGRDQLQPTPATGSLAPNAVIQGVFQIEGRVLSLVALDSLVPADLGEPLRRAS